MLARALRHQQTIGRSVCRITASTRRGSTWRPDNLQRHTENPRTFTSWPSASQQKQTSETRTNQPAVPLPHTAGVPRKKSLALPWMSKSDDGSPSVPDPLLAAQHVAILLSKDRVEDAQTFTRAASKHAQVIVSWNHLIGHALGNQKLREALKLFQEMKKRAQVPNAQTFTILFRGLAQSKHPKTAVSEAVKLYQSMLTRERVQPNVIHLNAVLKVCAAAGDLDSLFTIVESANDSARSPDGQTYTIILNGLRAPLVDRQRQPSEDEQLRNAEEAATKEAIQRAKTIWREVIERWRAGAIVIDEALVCAMGRILILGDQVDQKSVVELIEQTMNIAVKSQEQGQIAQPIDVSAVQTSTTKSVMSPARTSLRRSGPGSSTGFATPGNNSLSLVLEALAQSGQTSPALSYWDVFVNKYGVPPDTQNWTALLHAFSRGRNSNSAANALDKIPADILQTKHVRTAMKACLRDVLNKNAFDNATRILKSMTTKLVLPDIAAMQIYLRVADASKKPFENEEGFFDEKAKYAHGRQLGAAVNNLQEPHTILRQHVDSLKLDSITNSKEWLQKSALLQDLVAVSRTMYATYDRLIFDKLVPDKVAEAIKPLRNQLNRVIQGYFDERVKRDPAFDRKAAEKGENAQTAPVHKPREEVKQWPKDAAMPHGFSQRKGKHYSGMHQISFKRPEQFEKNAELMQQSKPRQQPAWGETESVLIQGQRRERSHARAPPRQTMRSLNQRDQINTRERGPRRDGQVRSKEEFWAMAG